MKAGGAKVASLLPYALRKTAAKQLLYGGVRVLQLTQKPPPVFHHRSARTSVPTGTEAELRDMGVEAAFVGERMFAVNLPHRNRHQMSIIRSQDVLRRFVAENRAADPQDTRRQRLFHVSRAHLSIHRPAVVGSSSEALLQPASPANAAAESQAAASVGRTVFGVGARFMPLQTAKPLPTTFSPAQRTSGLTSPAGRLKQELLDRKGFGWQRKQRTLWQQDQDTKGYHPEKYY